MVIKITRLWTTNQVLWFYKNCMQGSTWQAGAPTYASTLRQLREIHKSVVHAHRLPFDLELTPKGELKRIQPPTGQDLENRLALTAPRRRTAAVPRTSQAELQRIEEEAAMESLHAYVTFAQIRRSASWDPTCMELQTAPFRAGLRFDTPAEEQIPERKGRANVTLTGLMASHDTHGQNS